MEDEIKLPKGWTPVNQPQDDRRDVSVVLRYGQERKGWYSRREMIWRVYPVETKGYDDLLNKQTRRDNIDPDPYNPVIGWREIKSETEPEPEQIALPVGYILICGDSFAYPKNIYTNQEYAEDAAKELATDNAIIVAKITGIEAVSEITHSVTVKKLN